jgi:hypothetical protein
MHVASEALIQCKYTYYVQIHWRFTYVCSRFSDLCFCLPLQLQFCSYWFQLKLEVRRSGLFLKAVQIFNFLWNSQILAKLHITAHGHINTSIFFMYKEKSLHYTCSETTLDWTFSPLSPWEGIATFSELHGNQGFRNIISIRCHGKLVPPHTSLPKIFLNQRNWMVHIIYDMENLGCRTLCDEL